MSGDQTWAKCGQCGAELKQSDKQCPECGSTRKSYERKALVIVGVKVKTKVKQKRKGFKNPVRQMSSGWHPSGDPKLKNGVQIEIITDQEEDEFHQVVKDARTGEIIHEEHEPLSQHKNQPKR
jgi:RNA polymerase subunit RPABC4/transcription elongation factor Spt4